MLHLYWPSMIYENEHSEDEECGCNTCGDLDGNVLYTICELEEQDGNFHDEPSGDVLSDGLNSMIVRLGHPERRPEDCSVVGSLRQIAWQHDGDH